MVSAPTTENHVVIDGHRVNILGFEQLRSAIFARILAGQGFTLATLNLDHLVKLRADPVFAAAYKRMTFLTADGAPIVYLGRRTSGRLERVTGADLVKPICEQAAHDGVPIYLFGTTTQSLGVAASRLQALYPKLIVSGCEAPPQGFDYTSAAADDSGRRMAASGARLCFVCLGAPKQELFADRMAARHPEIGFLCVGAAIDFIADSQIRAPRMLRNHGLEWSWRLLSNPRRFLGRYARSASLFFRLALLHPQVPRDGDGTRV